MKLAKNNAFFVLVTIAIHSISRSDKKLYREFWFIRMNSIHWCLLSNSIQDTLYRCTISMSFHPQKLLPCSLNYGRNLFLRESKSRDKLPPKINPCSSRYIRGHVSLLSVNRTFFEPQISLRPHFATSSICFPGEIFWKITSLQREENENNCDCWEIKEMWWLTIESRIRFCFIQISRLEKGWNNCFRD